MIIFSQNIRSDLKTSEFRIDNTGANAPNKDEHGQDWIGMGLDQDRSQFWPDQDWIGLQFF